MINIYWTFFEICLCIVEILLFDIFLSRFGQKNFWSNWQRYGMILGFGLLIHFIGLFKFSFIISMLFSIAIYSLYAAISHRLKQRQSIVVAMLFICMILVIDMLVTYSMALLLPINVLDTYKESKMSRFTCGITSKVVLFAFVMIFLRQNKQNKEELSSLSTKLLFYTVLISIICLYTVGCFIQMEGHEVKPLQEICLCILVLGIFVINILSYVMIKQLNEKVVKEKKMEMVQYHNKVLEKMILENKTLEMEWRRNRHDFNNHLSCIDMLLQMQNMAKARTYIQNLTHSFLGSAGTIDVGNEIANAVLNQKWVLANKNQIAFNIEGILPEVLEIDQVDICAILSNSIDNAIEAVLKIEEVEKRNIDIYIKSYDKYLVLEVSNTVKELILHASEKLETTKRDKKHHGIGMTSMQMIVDKYKGHMEWSCQDYCFHLVILLPFMAD